MSHSDGRKQHRERADLIASRWHQFPRKASPEAMERQARRLAADWASSGDFPRLSVAGGDSLSSELRSFAQQRLGIHVDPIRIHTDGRAADMARSAQASAMTLRDDIYFAA